MSEIKKQLAEAKIAEGNKVRERIQKTSGFVELPNRPLRVHPIGTVRNREKYLGSDPYKDTKNPEWLEIFLTRHSSISMNTESNRKYLFPEKEKIVIQKSYKKYPPKKSKLRKFLENLIKQIP